MEALLVRVVHLARMVRRLERGVCLVRKGRHLVPLDHLVRTVLHNPAVHSSRRRQNRAPSWTGCFVLQVACLRVTSRLAEGLEAGPVILSVGLEQLLGAIVALEVCSFLSLDFEGALSERGRCNEAVHEAKENENGRRPHGGNEKLGTPGDE